MAKTAVDRQNVMIYLKKEDHESLKKICDYVGVGMSPMVTMLIREKARSLFPDTAK